MDEVLTVEEIKSRYDSEWVLLADPKVNDHLEVLAGKVVCHSKDRDDVDRKEIELGLESAATLFTGRIPDDVVYVL